MADNKRVGIFAAIVVLILALLTGWLALVTPEYQTKEVTHDIPLKDLLDS